MKRKAIEKAIEREKVVEMLWAGGQLLPSSDLSLFDIPSSPPSSFLFLFLFFFFFSSLCLQPDRLYSSLFASQLSQPTWASCSQHQVMWRSSSLKSRAKTTKEKRRQPYFTLIAQTWSQAVHTLKECSHLGGKDPEVTIPLSEATRSKAWKWCWGWFMEWTPSQRLSLLRMSGTPSRPATSINWIPKGWWAGSHNGSNGLTRKPPQDGRIGLSIASFYFLAISLITQKHSNTCQRDSSTTRQVISQKWHRQIRHLLSQCICPLSSCVSWNHSQL